MAREEKGLAQSHLGSLIAPNLLHILALPSLVLVRQSHGVELWLCTLSSEQQVGGNPQVRVGSLPPSLPGDFIHPMASRMGQWRADRILEKKNLAKCLSANLCPLCKPQFPQLMTDRVRRGCEQEGALAVVNKQEHGREHDINNFNKSNIKFI